MRTLTHKLPVALAGVFLFACSAPPPDPVAPEKPGTGGTSSPASGGRSGTGGSAPSATGGATGAGGTTGTGGAAAGGTTGSGGSAAGGATGSGGSGSGGAPATTPDAGSAPADSAAPPSAPPSSEGAPYGCKTCKKIFNGTSLDGWETNAEGAWVARDGLLASTGKPNDIWTKEDFGDVRIFFQVRQEKGNHKPGTILFGTRPAPGQAPKRGLGGAQFQPPNGASWNYGAGGTFKRLTNPNFNVNNWHQCEVLVKEAGSFRAACCPVTGNMPCKATEVLQWMGKGKKFPFSIQMHNAGLFDEYKEIWVELNPTVDDLVSTK